MKYVFLQGYLDSLCGVYSIVNADKELNGYQEEENQRLFNDTISYLSNTRKLKSAIINGISYRDLVTMANNVIGHRVKITGGRKFFDSTNDWWSYCKDFLGESGDRVIIISISGREDHYTVVKSMTDKLMYLSDSGGIKIIRKSSCALKGYNKADKLDKYIILPYQNIYLERKD